VKTFRLRATSDLTPAIEGLLEGFSQRRLSPLGVRERGVELASGATFLAVALSLALLVPGRPLSPLLAFAMVVAYAVASRVRFAVGSGYTVPTQLVFVPMLFVLPAAVAPLLVAAGIALGNLPDYLARRTHPYRAVVALGDSWHALGPAVVLLAAGAHEPTWADWPIYLGALGAQFLFDSLSSTLRGWLALGLSPRFESVLLGWVYLVDLLLAPIGLLAAFAAADNPFAPLLTLPVTALLALFARERQSRIDSALELSRAYRGTSLLLSDVLEADHEYTGNHSRNVVTLAMAVAEEMGLDSRQSRNVEFGALLHDIGKIAVPNEVINKDGPLTEDEWLVIRTHTIEGQRMLDRVGGVLGDVGRIVRSSHEHWDGSGYPDGLAGEAIPLEATIVSCCDAFDAMTTDRSYRAAMAPEEALTEARVNAGTQFNPAVVQALIRVVERRADGGYAPSRSCTKRSTILMPTNGATRPPSP
jgi:putative nucleotidyltransferase with HDIG domain